MDSKKEGEKTEDIIKGFKQIQIDILWIRTKLEEIRRKQEKLIRKITEKVKITPETLRNQRIYLEEKKIKSRDKRYLYIRFFDGEKRRSVYVPSELKSTLLSFIDIKEILTDFDDFEREYHEKIQQIYDIAFTIKEKIDILKERISLYF